jgi:4'-phosphopantetheinyl transferase
VRLTAGKRTSEGLYSALSEDERQRAGRFHFDIHRQRYVLARGLLRAILGHYLDVEASAVQLAYGPHGKPAVMGAPLRFNLSHSEDLAVYALARELELGVDVERIRPMPDADGIARRYFSPAERAQLYRVSPDRFAQAFFHCWTRKEAYVKALGGGLSVPLDGFQVSLLPQDPSRLLRIEGDAQRAAEWSLLNLDAAEGYAGALATHATAVRLQTRRCRNVEECLEVLAP